jgi:tetratricopeptide (TPR) repeat protein
MRVNEALPIPTQFDHVITLVKLKDHDVWLDSTPEVAPSRMLMAGLRDKLALAIPATGDARLVRTEATLPFPSFAHETITGQLDIHGVLTAHFDLTLRGDAEVIYRSAFHQVARAQWQELQQRISNANGFAGDVSAVDASLPEKTANPFHVSWDYTRKDFGDWPNRQFPGMSTWFETKIAEDALAPKRAMLMDPTDETEVKVTLTLPEDEAVTPPSNVNRSTTFANYTSVYTVRDRNFTMDRTLRYKVHELPASEFGDYRTFLRAVSDDASQMIQLVPFHITREPDVVKNAPTAPTQEARQNAGHAVGAPPIAQYSAGPTGTGSAASWFKDVQARLRSGDVSGASSLLDEVKQVNDHERYLWLGFGDVEWRHQNMTGAIDDYNKEIELHPDIGLAYRRLADAYALDGEWANVEGVERSWCKANPKDAEAEKMLGYTLLMLERFHESVDAYQAAVTLSLDPDALKVELGGAQLKSGQIDAGKATLHAVIDHTSDVMIANNAAYQLGNADVDLDTAEKSSRKSVKVFEAKCAGTKLDSATDDDLHNPNKLAENWDTLGWIAFRLHRLPEAEAYVRSAWLLDTHAEMGLHLAQIYDAEGKNADAIATYRQAASVLSAKHPWPYYAHMKQQMLSRASALAAASTPAGDDDAEAEPPGLRSYSIPSPTNGAYAHAEFLLLLSNDRADSVRFLRGDEKLTSMTAALETLTYRSPLPPQSKTKILRRGTLMCAMGAITCELRLAAPGTAQMN